MDDHIHTGMVTFVTVGVYAVVFIWLTRLIAAKLTEYPATQTVGTALGAVVHFG